MILINKYNGFTLIELMVVVIIVAILATIAYPSYISQVTLTNRTNAMGVLLQDANYMERFYTLNGCYNNAGPDGVCGTSDDVAVALPYTTSPTTGSSIYYAVTMAVGVSGSSFVLTANPSGTSQATDGNLTLDNNGVQGWAKNPSGKTNSWR